ncbi:MAG: hypothetical protein ACLFV5_00555 [Anaerolineales bacterium]
MNTDIGELIERIEIKNSVNVAVVAGLVVSLVLFVVVLVSLVGALREQRMLQRDYESSISSIERIRTMQEQGPETVRQRISEAKEELGSLLAGMPTRGEVRAEIVRYYTYASDVDVELVRMERVAVSEKEGEGYYENQRFVLEARGLTPDLMRFLARVGGGEAYDTFILSNIYIASNGPSTAEADLEVFSSELSLDEPLPAPAPGEAPPQEEEGGVGPEYDRALALGLGDDVQKAVAMEGWEW